MVAITRKLDKLLEQLTDQQKQAIDMLVEREEYAKGDPDRKSLDQIAEELDTVRKTIYNWRNTPVFQEALAEASRERLAVLAPKAYGAMSKLMSGAQPSTKALDLYFKTQGWIKNEQSIDLTTRSRDDADLEAEIERLTGASKPVNTDE